MWYVAYMATSKQPTYRHYLREWREHRGLLQEDLERMTLIAKSVISRYETGSRRMHMEAQIKLMRALQITPAQFFSPPDAPSLDALVSGASDEDRRRLVNLVKAFLGSDGAE